MQPVKPFDPTAFLKVRDIALWESELARFVSYPIIDDGQKLGYQSMRGIRADLAGMLDDSGKEIEILKIFVTLGIRCVVPRSAVVATEQVVEASPDEEDETIVLYALESTFAVDYEVLQTMPEEQVSAFAQFNSVHNVWPFWRHHVYDTLKRASLPVPEVPFFAGNQAKEAEAGT
ncbi:hypothetical protein ACF3M1_13260 [Luteimonas sp. WGS1318]|uniref:hypothetical protein n=1 Tax=Luteimonas sp. WGS1318 TaxID=3366815 RepID=UPI00372D4242